MIIDGLLWFSGLGALAAALFNIIGSNLYDVAQIKMSRKQRLHPYARQFKERPIVTAIVFTENSVTNVGDCLSSLLASNYRKLQIIVADNASTDATKKVVLQSIADNPGRQIKLYAKRRQDRPKSVLRQAYKLYAEGELVFLVEPTSILNKTAVTKAVMHFNAQPKLNVLNPNYGVVTAFKTTDLLQNFSSLLRNRARKANGYLNADYFADFKGGRVYTAETFAKLPDVSVHSILTQGDRKLNIGYASDVFVVGRALSIKDFTYQYFFQQLGRLRALTNASRLLSNSHNPDHTAFMLWCRLPLSLMVGLSSLFAPIMIGYFAYLAFSLRQPGFLLAVMLGVGLLVFFAVLDDKQLKLSQKVKYIGLIPVSYGWFYALACINLAVGLISLLSLTRLSVKRT